MSRVYRVIRHDEITRKKNVENDIKCVRTIITIRQISCKSGPTVTSYTIRKRVCEKFEIVFFNMRSSYEKKMYASTVK
jgi:hypothetical protein